MGAQLGDGIVIVLAPDEIGVARRIDSVESHDGPTSVHGQLHDIAVQLLCKWVCGINNQADAVLATECCHRWHIQGSCNALPMHEVNLLLHAVSGIEEGGAGLFKFLDGRASLGGASKNQYHASPFL